MKSRDVIIGCVLAIACATTLAAPAQAAQNDSRIMADGVMLKNERTGLCLDGNNQGDVYTHECGSTNPYQHWVFHTSEWYEDVMIQSTKTGRCLASKGSSVVGVACNSQDRSQQWAKTWVRDGLYALINESSRTAIDSDYAGKAYLRGYGSDNPYQHWYLSD